MPGEEKRIKIVTQVDGAAARALATDLDRVTKSAERLDSALAAGDVDRAANELGQMSDQAQRLGASLNAAVVGLDKVPPEARQAAIALDTLGEQAARAQTELNQMRAAGPAVAGSQRNMGVAILEGSRALEDLQYGIRGVINNIPPLLLALGVSAGVAGAISAVVVALAVLIPRLSSLGATSESASRSVRDLTIITGDAKEAAEAWDEALKGNFESLAEYGIIVDDTAALTDKLEAAQRQLAARGAEEARKKTETLTGALASLLRNYAALIIEGGKLELSETLVGQAFAKVGVAIDVLAFGLGHHARALQDIADTSLQAKENLQDTAAAASDLDEKLKAIDDRGKESSRALGRAGLSDDARRQLELLDIQRQTELARLDSGTADTDAAELDKQRLARERDSQLAAVLGQGPDAAAQRQFIQDQFGRQIAGVDRGLGASREAQRFGIETRFSQQEFEIQQADRSAAESALQAQLEPLLSAARDLAIAFQDAQKAAAAATGTPGEADANRRLNDARALFDKFRDVNDPTIDAIESRRAELRGDTAFARQRFGAQRELDIVRSSGAAGRFRDPATLPPIPGSLGDPNIAALLGGGDRLGAEQLGRGQLAANSPAVQRIQQSLQRAADGFDSAEIQQIADAIEQGMTDISLRRSQEIQSLRRLIEQIQSQLKNNATR